MQCIWFQRELACAYRRTKQYGEALVKFHEIDKVSKHNYLIVMYFFVAF